MRFLISFKTPDAVEFAAEAEYAYETPDEDELAEFRHMGYEDPVVEWRAQKAQELKDFVAKWVQYGECVDIEFDTLAGTATVKTVK